jgi:uroporphyrinogen III methyltransferase/synthase
MGSGGRVYIIGAGPGDPGLMSVRGVRLLADADVVVYDRAVEAVLRWARPDAERIGAGAPAERDVAQDAISMLVAEKAREGHVVARVKWGDPFVFDSGAKEALFLHEQGVPFEIVPGVSAAVGTAAYAGIPLTYPNAGDTVVLVRGHEDETGRLADVDWESVARLDGTLACYASGRLISALLQQLAAHGTPPDSAAALVFRGTEPGQRTVTGTVGSLLEATSAAPPDEPAPALVRRTPALRPARRRHAIPGTVARTRRPSRERRRRSHPGADVQTGTARRPRSYRSRRGIGGRLSMGGPGISQRGDALSRGAHEGSAGSARARTRARRGGGSVHG